MEYYIASTITAANASRQQQLEQHQQAPEQPRSNRVSLTPSAASSSSSGDDSSSNKHTSSNLNQAQHPIGPGPGRPIIPARSPLRPPTRAKSLSISPNPRTRTLSSHRNSNLRDSQSTDSNSPGTPRTPITPVDYPAEQEIKSRDSFPSLDELLERVVHSNPNSNPNRNSESTAFASTPALAPGAHGHAQHQHARHSHSHSISQSHQHQHLQHSESYPSFHPHSHTHMLSSSDDSSMTVNMPPPVSYDTTSTLRLGSLSISSEFTNSNYNSANIIGAGSGYAFEGSQKALPPRPDSPLSDPDRDRERDEGREREGDDDPARRDWYREADRLGERDVSNPSPRRRPRRTLSTQIQEDTGSRSSKASSMLVASPVPIGLTPALGSSPASTMNATITPPAASGNSASPTAGPTMTKRQYALHELLSSERAYASDLVLIRDIHVPLALGLTIPLSNVTLPASPPNSSGPSSRTVSTASDSSNGSNSNSKSHTGDKKQGQDNNNTNSDGNPPSNISENNPPMTADDARLVFGNIAEVALFSDLFTEEIEAALGKEVEGGEGEDRVGELFLRIAPELERPYKQYITRHPNAIAHLNALPSTPALQSYLSYTQTIASALSHAWDLSSLLIKPVQRLMKYPLLLSAIIDETPDDHPDKERLIEARMKMEEVARNVNEGRRRAEVVKDVLSGANSTGSGKGGKKGSAGSGSGSGGVGVGMAASVNLSKMKSLRHGGVTAATMRVSALSEGGNSEAAQVEAYQNELKRLDAFAQQFAKAVVDWGRMTSNMMLGLRTWSASFGKVIGLSLEQNSEAFDAFVEVVQQTLLPLAVDLENVINERVLKDLAHLLETMSKPLKLMRSMDEQEPYHYHLLTMPVSAKNRPPPALLEASQNYLALRGQLAAELPTYIGLLHRGLAVLVRRLADIQMRFWRDVKERWGELWEMLRVDGELNAGWEETTAVWWGRWVDVDGCIAGLGVCQPVKDSVTKWMKEREEREMRERIEREKEMRALVALAGSSATFAGIGGFGMVPPVTQSQQPPKRPSRGLSGSGMQQLGINAPGNGKASQVYNMMGALEPNRKERPPPLPLSSAPSMNPAMPSPPSSMTMFPVSAPMPLSAGQMYGHAKNRSRDIGESGRGKRTSHEGSATNQVGGVVRNVIRRLSSQDGMQASAQQGNAVPYASRRNRDDTRVHQQRRKAPGYSQAATPAEDYAEYLDHQGQQYAMPGSYEHAIAGPSTSPSSPSRPSIPRTKSMPLSDKVSASTGATLGPSYTSASILPGGSAYYYEDDYDQNARSYSGPYQQQQQPQHELRRSASSKQRDSGGSGQMRERGRRPSSARVQPQSPAPVNVQVTTTTASMVDPIPPRRHASKSKEKPEREARSRERPTHARKRSGSVKSITSFFSSTRDQGSSPTHQEQTLTPSQRDSWVSKPAKYVCQVIHPCKPPASVSYYSFPFFTLQEGELYEVLQEAGHPSIHPKLPLYVDDGEDCLLLCRDERDTVGWALASFLEPVLA